MDRWRLGEEEKVGGRLEKDRLVLSRVNGQAGRAAGRHQDSPEKRSRTPWGRSPFSWVGPAGLPYHHHCYLTPAEMDASRAGLGRSLGAGPTPFVTR